MKYSPYERETIILYNEAENTASVYTYDHRLIEKLKELHKKYPDQIFPEHPVRHGGYSFIVPKRCVSIRSRREPTLLTETLSYYTETIVSYRRP